MAIPYTDIASLQEPLTRQIEALCKTLPVIFQKEAVGALLIGSCSTGTATYRSDVDVLVILRHGQLTFSRVTRLREQFEIATGVSKPLPVQINFVLPHVFETTEPAMRTALEKSVILWDPEGLLETHLKRESS